EPPPMAELLSADDLPSQTTARAPGKWIDKLLGGLGIASNAHLEKLDTQFTGLQKYITHQQQIIIRQQQVIEQLTNRTDQLWAVNNTWGWNDNATLKLRRRKRCP